MFFIYSIYYINQLCIILEQLTLKFEDSLLAKQLSIIIILKIKFFIKTYLFSVKMNKKIFQQDHISYNSNIQKNPYSWNPYFNINDRSPNKKILLSQRSPSPKLMNITPIKCLYKQNGSNGKHIEKSKSLRKGLFQLQIQKTDKQNSVYECNLASQLKMQKKMQFVDLKNNVFTQLIKKIETNPKRQTSIQSTSTCSQKISKKIFAKQDKNDSEIMKFKKGQNLCFKNINGLNKQNIKDQSISFKDNCLLNNQYVYQQNKVSTLSVNSNTSTNKFIQFKNNISNNKFIKKQKSDQKFSDLPTSTPTLTNNTINKNNTNSNLDLKKCNSNKLEINCSIKIDQKVSNRSSIEQVNMSREDNSVQLDMSPYFI